MTDLATAVDGLLAAYPPATTERMTFLHAQYDAGLAWVHFPPGHGGLGLTRAEQALVNDRLRSAGAPTNAPDRNRIGLGMAAPTILRYGTEEQRARLLRPLWTGEEIWCQLFSEPGAGSDLAAVATRARQDLDTWIVDGQKVWTSSAHLAQRAILVARTDVEVPKHAGLSYFVVDMTDPGVDVRPLRQLTGEAEFNEVFLNGVRVPDTDRLGDVGAGWEVATYTLSNERVAIGGRPTPREGGMIGKVAHTWRERPDLRRPDLHDRLLDLWVGAEVARLNSHRTVQIAAPGPAGSALKLAFADNAQRLSALEVELLGAEGLEYGSWPMIRPDSVDMLARDAGYRYLRAKGNSIEGGTSEILRNIIAERVLGFPGEARPDKGIAWKDAPR
ncbi:acyl-CoA dehydrogenase family protein [Marmoricola sp. RAF53]|uniref:acyl-CoA dehydrogenase family protein n=1 Tax=Marmoricola sp. RAF53 TaxID=3233059 RepID=UPI003F9C1E1C